MQKSYNVYKRNFETHIKCAAVKNIHDRIFFFDLVIWRNETTNKLCFQPPRQTETIVNAYEVPRLYQEVGEPINILINKRITFTTYADEAQLRAGPRWRTRWRRITSDDAQWDKSARDGREREQYVWNKQASEQTTPEMRKLSQSK